MLSDARSRTRFGIVAMSCIVMLGALSFAIPADADGPATTTHLGPVLTYDENPSYTNGRDAGISVALPNGEALWVFGDTPTYLYLNGQWQLRFFIGGTSAARGLYTPGHVPAPMTEVVVGHPASLENEPTQFIPAPTDIRLPDGSGRLCTADNGAVENGRWVTGAALLPDDTNVLITYAGMCVSSASSISAQSFGFMEYNWRLNTISVPPVDVFPPSANGTPLPRDRIFGSPVVSNNQVTLFSETCCSPEDFHTLTIPADVASLADPASYISHTIPTLRPAVNSLFDANVGVYPGGEWRVVDLTDHVGSFEVFSAPAADGPWSLKTTGTLPGCATSPEACYSLVGHPELSTSNALVVSYYQPGYGPGVAGHPYPHPPINHVVLASIAIGPGPGPQPGPPPDPSTRTPRMPTTVKAGPLPTATPTGALKVTYAAGSNSGTKITTFTATCKSPNAGVTKSAVHNGLTAAPITVTGLTTKKTYTCSVTATNAWGIGPASVPSAPVIVGAPSAPTGVHATRTAAGKLQVAFAPGANNGAAITRFTATCKSSDGGVTKAVSATVHPIAVTGLTSGKTYTCAVSATNSRGVGPQSAASPAVKA